MRPERLRISAFGPYAGEEDMDFPFWKIIRFSSSAALPAQENPPFLMPCAMRSMGKPAAPSDREKICGATMWGMTEKPMWNLTLP